MGWKKPQWLQKAQNAAQKVADVIAAPVQTVAKAVAAPVKAVAKAVSPTPSKKSSSILPGLKNIMPGIGATLKGGRDIIYGIGDVIASPVDGNFTKGVKKIGGGLVDVIKHPARGLVIDPVIQAVGGVGKKGSVEEATEGNKGTGGRSGGAGVRTVPADLPEQGDDERLKGGGKPVGGGTKVATGGAGWTPLPELPPEPDEPSKPRRPRPISLTSDLPMPAAKPKRKSRIIRGLKF
jgi:hypothetical protein